MTESVMMYACPVPGPLDAGGVYHYAAPFEPNPWVAPPNVPIGQPVYVPPITPDVIRGLELRIDALVKRCEKIEGALAAERAERESAEGRLSHTIQATDRDLDRRVDSQSKRIDALEQVRLPTCERIPDKEESAPDATRSVESESQRTCEIRWHARSGGWDVHWDEDSAWCAELDDALEFARMRKLRITNDPREVVLEPDGASCFLVAGDLRMHFLSLQAARDFAVGKAWRIQEPKEKPDCVLIHADGSMSSFWTEREARERVLSYPGSRIMRLVPIEGAEL